MTRKDPSTLWERPQPQPRPAPVALSREGIVQAAIGLADAEGLASVTLRGLAAALGAGPMRLYGFLATKEDLLALMVDAVYAEILAGGESDAKSWRAQVVDSAQAVRQAARRHPWFGALLGGRPHQGPNALAFLEAMLTAVGDAPGLDAINATFQATKLVNAYLLGAIRDEAAEAMAAQESGLTQMEWQNASWPYLERIIATGRFPMLAKVVRDVDHPTPDVTFSRGLDCILDAITGGASG